MYASQTKRLCVRGAPSEETRVQHHSSAAVAPTTEDTIQKQAKQTTLAPSNRSTASVSTNMTTPATSKTDGVNSSPNDTIAQPVLTLHHDFDRTIGTEHKLINKLATETLEETKLELLLSIRNLITACNKKKDSIVSNPNFNKILSLIDDNRPSTTVKTQLVLLLCSVAKSGEHNVSVLNESFVDDKIFNLILSSNDEALIEACLRCMRSIMSWPRVSRMWLLYESQNQPNSSPTEEKDSPSGRGSLQKIINYARVSNSFIVQECVADIFAVTCGRNKDQALLYKAEAIPCIVKLLESPSNRVIIASLNWLTQMCLKNQLVSSEIINTRCPSGILVLDKLTSMMSKDKCPELQFLSARCFTHIFRAQKPEILKNDSRIVSHVLPTLVRMVHIDKPSHLRIKSAECIAYLIECDISLQNTASICDHLIDSLANMLEYEHNSILPLELRTSVQTHYKCSSIPERGISTICMTPYHQQSQYLSSIDMKQTQMNDSKMDSANEFCSDISQEMKRAAFLALASLASNLEPIRQKIFNTGSVKQHLINSLTDSDTKTLKSVLTCLLSLSRSVHQLRTSFNENSTNFYSALKGLLNTRSNDVLILVLAILCNISLDFSPGKQHFMDTKTIDVLCNLTRKQDSILRLHGMWILMNIVYQLKDQNLKFQILRSLGINHLLSFLETEGDEEMVLKTLGFLRNLLSHKHIDAIMMNHGDQIMQSLVLLLEKPYSPRIKEQCLCVLTNIADGIASKKFIMSNKVILAYLACTICDDQAGDLRLAAICCITNLAHKEFEGSFERRDEMKKFGIDEKLKSMLNTNDPILSDRVRTAYNQFLIGVEDKYVN